MSTSFDLRKRRILQQLSAPAETYNDLSPKGSIDEGIRTLIDEINAIDGIVTTSSCAGRISVFLEGKRKTTSWSVDDQYGADPPSSKDFAGPGGKGGGSTWLFVSHSPLIVPEKSSDLSYHTLFGLGVPHESHDAPPDGCRFAHLKFEPMILHLLTSSLNYAQTVLAAALDAGFRESGAVSLLPSRDGTVSPMVAVRSIGLAFDAIVGYQEDSGDVVSLVDELYLRTTARIANERFKMNTERIERFRKALFQRLLQCPSASSSGTRPTHRPDWEDVETRKQRKREEGLRKQRALRASDGSPPSANHHAGDDYLGDNRVLD